MEFSKTRQRFGYGAADMASNLIWPMICTYLTVYYNRLAFTGRYGYWHYNPGF